MGTKKPSLRFFEKGAWKKMCLTKAYDGPTSDNNPAIHARMSENIQLLVQLMCFLRS